MTDTNPTDTDTRPHVALGCTPGPWAAEMLTVDKKKPKITIRGKGNIRRVAVWDLNKKDDPGNEHPIKEVEANVELMAAATELYDALVLSEVIIGELAGICHDPPTELDAIYFDALCRIKAALAKARGGA